MEALASSAVTRRDGHRETTVGLLLALITIAVLTAGGWGVISSLNADSPPTGVGDAVGVPGGLLVVDKVTPERMAAMQTGKFANAGMSGMSSMGMDMAPEGQQRFVVDVTLAAESAELSYSPDDFRISGKGIKKSGPIRHQLEAGTLPAGGAISGSLVFQAPVEAKELTLSFGDEEQKVALNLDPAEEGDSHSSHDGGAAPPEGGGHSDDHPHGKHGG